MNRIGPVTAFVLYYMSRTVPVTAFVLYYMSRTVPVTAFVLYVTAPTDLPPYYMSSDKCLYCAVLLNSTMSCEYNQCSEGCFTLYSKNVAKEPNDMSASINTSAVVIGVIESCVTENP